MQQPSPLSCKSFPTARGPDDSDSTAAFRAKQKHSQLQAAIAAAAAAVHGDVTTHFYDSDTCDPSLYSSDNVQEDAADDSVRVASNEDASPNPLASLLGYGTYDDDEDEDEDDDSPSDSVTQQDAESVDPELAGFFDELETEGLLADDQSEKDALPSTRESADAESGKRADDEAPANSDSGKEESSVHKDPGDVDDTEGRVAAGTEMSAGQLVLENLDWARDWARVLDSASGKEYFWNCRSNEVSWDAPEKDRVPGSDEQQGDDKDVLDGADDRDAASADAEISTESLDIAQPASSPTQGSADQQADTHLSSDLPPTNSSKTSPTCTQSPASSPHQDQTDDVLDRPNDESPAPALDTNNTALGTSPEPDADCPLAETSEVVEGTVNVSTDSTEVRDSKGANEADVCVDGDKGDKGAVGGSEALRPGVTDWSEVFDTASGRCYYWNSVTGEVAWEAPDEWRVDTGSAVKVVEELGVLPDAATNKLESDLDAVDKMSEQLLAEAHGDEDSTGVEEGEIHASNPAEGVMAGASAALAHARAVRALADAAATANASGTLARLLASTPQLLLLHAQLQVRREDLACLRSELRGTDAAATTTACARISAHIATITEALPAAVLAADSLQEDGEVCASPPPLPSTTHDYIDDHETPPLPADEAPTPPAPPCESNPDEDTCEPLPPGVDEVTPNLQDEHDFIEATPPMDEHATSEYGPPLPAPVRPSPSQPTVQQPAPEPVQTSDHGEAPPVAITASKKRKKGTGTGLNKNSKKGRKTNALLDKWAAVAKDIETEDEARAKAVDPEARELVKQAEIEEWMANQFRTGEAQSNPNFIPILFDWRARVAALRQHDTPKGSAPDPSSNPAENTSPKGLADDPVDAQPSVLHFESMPDLGLLSLGLPIGWEAMWEQSTGDVYYGNTAKQETSWLRPLRFAEQ